MAARLYRNGAFAENDWQPLGDDDAVPASGRVLLPLDRYLELAGGGGATARMAVLLRAHEDPARLAPHLDRLEMVAVEFEKFSDGRGYSIARLLRQRHRFAGELRAVGDVLLDQIPLMRRVGFDAFLVANEPTIRALEAGHDVDVPLYLQPSERGDEVPAGARYWARRPAAAQLS
jgi:phosphoadenosine phosphosulfate reductase